MTGRQHQQRFTALLQEHRKIVFKVAAIYARTPEDRADLEQEIRTQLWRAFARYDERRGKFSTWLYRIALNVAISQSRTRYRDGSGRVEPLEQHHLDSIGGGTVIDEPDARIRMLYAVIASLDPLNRALILLYLEDRSYAEIADVLGISETNVATKISRVKQTLRGRLARSTHSRTEHKHGTR